MPGTSASHAVIWIATAALAALPGAAGPPATVTGRVTITERGNRPGTDVGQTVVWLEGPGLKAPAAKPASVLTEGKEFRPRVTVIPAGSTVTFPNNDPFNHNVFSLSDEGIFDLGLYGRGQSKSTRLNRAGVVRVYCNVHATMAAYIVVRDNPHYTQPSADGTFAITGVPPGKYQLHAWHERAPEVTREIEVDAQGATDVGVQLDARGYKFVEHLNKFGQPYSRGGARY